MDIAGGAADHTGPLGQNSYKGNFQNAFFPFSPIFPNLFCATNCSLQDPERQIGSRPNAGPPKKWAFQDNPA